VQGTEQNLVQCDGERERDDQTHAVTPEVDHRRRSSPRAEAHPWRRRRPAAKHEPAEP
jgi:hypothetical protein